MQLNIPMQFRGTYDFTLKRKDGTIQRETVHNIATNNIVSTRSSSELCIGSGSGTPAATDTKLFTHLWSINASTISNVSNIGENGAVMSMTYVVPATAAYVATITEVGMGPQSTIWTHAMLVDAEGNPISIVKTENDELTIVVTLELYTTITLPIVTKLEPFMSVSILPTLAVILLSRLVYGHRYYRALRGSNYTSSGSPYPYDALSIRPRNLRQLYGSYYTDERSGVIPGMSSWTADKTLRQLKLSTNLRCKNDSFNSHYYRYLQFTWGMRTGYSGIGTDYSYSMCDTPMMLDLRDPDIFPPQLLANISVATGDGETTDFTCPLNYFQKDTEVLYKNGVKLTRDVDYTIENVANKDRWPELMHILYSDDIKITSDASLWGTGGYLQFMAEANTARNNAITYDTDRVCTSFNDTYPLHFDWGAPRKCNCLQGYLHTYYAGTVYVEYSTDNAIWEQAASQVINTDGGTNTAIDLTWEPIEAQYWRIRVTRYGTSTSKTTLAYFNTGGSAAYLGYSNPLGIHFTTPPAENDVITMDCYVDIPLKNANFAFNLALDLTITFN